MTDFKMLFVSGSRTIKDYNFIEKCMNETKDILYKYQSIITGDAAGVDYNVVKYARNNKIDYFVMHPKWELYGKVAGLFKTDDRIEMCNEGIAIWDGKSRGTQHAIKRLKKEGKLLRVFRKIIG